MVGRKIGFTNREIWPLYGVDAPMWAPLFDRSVQHGDDARAFVVAVVHLVGDFLRLGRQVGVLLLARHAAGGGEQRRVTAVIALNATDYDAWCKANGKSARDRNILMATPATARGLRDAGLDALTTNRPGWLRAQLRGGSSRD